MTRVSRKQVLIFAVSVRVACAPADELRDVFILDLPDEGADEPVTGDVDLGDVGDLPSVSTLKDLKVEIFEVATEGVEAPRDEG